MPAPTLGGVTLPQPSDYRERRGYRGGVNEMADGSQQIDLVNAAAKQTFRLGFSMIDGTAKAAVESGWATVASATVTYADPLGSTFDVTRAGAAEIEWAWTLTANGFLYSGSIELREA